MRVLCMIPALGEPGGAQRTMSYLLAELVKRHCTTLLTLEASGAKPFFPLPEPLDQIRIDKLGGAGLTRLYRVASRFWAIRHEVWRLSPDIVISFMDTMNTAALISCAGLGIPVVVSERNDPHLHDIGSAKQALRDRVYPLARLVVVQTQRVASYFRPSLDQKLRVIGNPVPVSPIVASPHQSDERGRKCIITVGRLEPHKQIDQLINAFARLAGEWPDWDLVILGEGPSRGELEAQARAFGLGDRISLPGIARDVFTELSRAHLMAFPSRYEGFPNALAEGLAAGLPAVGRRAVSGVEELILDGQTGLLFAATGGADDLAQSLSRLMGDPGMRKQFGDAARRHMVNWSPSRIFSLWEDVLSEAAARSLPDSLLGKRGSRLQN